MHTNLLDTAKLASSGAAELLKRAYREDAGIESEYGRDIKTQADVALSISKLQRKNTHANQI